WHHQPTADATSPVEAGSEPLHQVPHRTPSSVGARFGADRPDDRRAHDHAAGSLLRYGARLFRTVDAEADRHGQAAAFLEGTSLAPSLLQGRGAGPGHSGYGDVVHEAAGTAQNALFPLRPGGRRHEWHEGQMLSLRSTP